MLPLLANGMSGRGFEVDYVRHGVEYAFLKISGGDIGMCNI